MQFPCAFYVYRQLDRRFVHGLAPLRNLILEYLVDLVNVPLSSTRRRVPARSVWVCIAPRSFVTLSPSGAAGLSGFLAALNLLRVSPPPLSLSLSLSLSLFCLSSSPVP